MELENALELFNDSLERCHNHAGFLDRFYDLFLASSADVAAKFAHTDLVQQKKMLKRSLYLVLSLGRENAEQETHLERIAQVHSHTERNIAPAMYALWLDSIVQAAQEHDPFFKAHTEEAWRMVLQRGIDFMIARY